MAKRDLHGSYSYYVNHKCRCDKCKMARRDYIRGWRARKKKAALAEETKAALLGDLMSVTIIQDIADERR